MKLQGGNRLRMLFVGAAAAGLLVPEDILWSADRFPMPTFRKQTPPAVQPANQPPQLLPGNATGVVPVAQTLDGKSEVQRQLELLYEKDGRDMPEMNMDLQPVPMNGAPNAPAGQGTAANGLRMQQPQQPQQDPAQQAPAVPQNKHPVFGFFKKLVPRGKEKTTPVPDFRPDVAPQPPESPLVNRMTVPQQMPAAQMNRMPQTAGLPAANTMPPALPTASVKDPAPAGASLPALSADPGLPIITSSRSVSVGNQLARMPSTPSSVLPALQVEPLPPLPASPVSHLPPMLATPQAITPPEESQTFVPPVIVQRPLVSAPAGSSVRNDLADPFTEMSEAEADKKLDPFTGLTLDDGSAKSAPRPAIAVETKRPKVETAQDDPFAAELRRMGIAVPGINTNSLGDVKPTETNVIEAKPAQPKAIEADLTENKLVENHASDAVPETAKPSPVLVSPRQAAPTFEGIADQATREKMRKIHERGTMKGLKGFCPVTLRDQRELVDAKPDFHSTFRGQKFHFADAEAKLKFDEDPGRYAPAAYGADVVALTRDKDVVEGTLDFAAWYKGRLYLFGAQEAHDTFVANPGIYATPVGIE